MFKELLRDMFSSKSLKRNNHKPQSLYAHIPFCVKKCHYCNFISYTKKNNFLTIRKEYVNSIIQEIHYRAGESENCPLKSIYFGGGTPTLLSPELLEQILDEIKNNFTITKNTEITIEANPGTVDKDYLKSIHNLGFNRISLGVQSFNNNELKLLGRVHTAEEAIETISDMFHAGFSNISIDLIYGIPEQTRASWQKTLDTATSLKIKHISAYGLKIEEGTYFDNFPPEILPDEDTTAEMYLECIAKLEEKGFLQYEISNFAQIGYESRHNRTYWENKDYIAVGVAAHGYTNGTRYSHTDDINEYIKNPTANFEEQIISQQERIEEAIFLGLRLIEGINIAEFETNYAINILETYSDVIKKHTEAGLLEITKERIKLTKNGLLLSNSVFTDFIG